MLRMFICNACNHSFDAKTAKCEDWRVEEKSFICPNCDVYLAKANTKNQDLKNIAVRSGISAYFIAGMAAANSKGYNLFAMVVVALIAIPMILFARKYYVNPNNPIVVYPLESRNA
jgi:hypothetical protein